MKGKAETRLCSAHGSCWFCFLCCH